MRCSNPINLEQSIAIAHLLFEYCYFCWYLHHEQAHTCHPNFTFSINRVCSTDASWCPKLQTHLYAQKFRVVLIALQRAKSLKSVTKFKLWHNLHFCDAWAHLFDTISLAGTLLKQL